jgi:hypothetical protein
MWWTCLCGWTNWHTKARCRNCGGEQALAREVGMTLWKLPKHVRHLRRLQFGIIPAFVVALAIVIAGTFFVALGLLRMLQGYVAPHLLQ